LTMLHLVVVVAAAARGERRSPPPLPCRCTARAERYPELRRFRLVGNMMKQEIPPK
jgi:hypothetical protein